MTIPDTFAGLHLFDGSQLGIQYQLVNYPLFGTKLPVYRNGPGYVCRIISVVGPDIHQQEIAILHEPGIRFIVKGGTVRA